MPDLIYLNDDLDSTVERLLNDKELAGCGLDREKVVRTIESFQGDEIACAVFLKKYAVRNDNNEIIELTLEEAKNRWAKYIATAENSFDDQKSSEYFKELYDYLLPAGRQMFALGNEYVKSATYTNCYVTKIEEDSLEGIYDAAKKLARTYSYGGGIGICIGELRPEEAKVSNSARFSTGAVSFMELYSLTTGLVGQHGRRGALMITIPVDHPDVENFIEIKHNNKDKVKHANISIKLTDDFMNAVVEDKDFVLSFTTKHEVISKKVRAKELWNKIIKSARDSAEPGLMFWDRMVEMSPSDTYPRLKVHSTNPCGEQILEVGGACVLSSLLLHTFVRNPYTEVAYFDFDLFEEMTARGVRHLDNVVELNFGRHGLEEQEKAASLGRRIGLGITGLADMYAALGIRYDSVEAMELTDRILEAKKLAEYNASIELAKHRGAFPLFNPERHFERGFCKSLPEDLQEKAKRHGLRNVAISTIAPNGSLSIIAQCSSGIEPIFAFNYKRFVEMGSERKDFSVYHQGIARYFDVAGRSEELPDYWVAAHEIDYHYRVKLQGMIQKHIDASISSTVNLPKNIDTKTVGKIYLEAWKEGLKGITVYREGSREGVLVTDEYAQAAGEIELDTVVQCVKAEGGDKFYIMTSYENGDVKKPYQVFVLNYKQSDRDTFIKTSNALIRMLKEKGVPEDRVDKYITRSKNSLAKLTRFISLSMKTDNLQECVDILGEHAFAGTLAAKLYDILSKSLYAKKTTCPGCSGENLRMEEGCSKCVDCGWSGCS